MFSSIEDVEDAADVAAGNEPAPKRPKPEPVDDAAFFAHVDKNADTYVQRLKDFVAIPGVSAEPARRPDVTRAVKWVQSWLQKLGANSTSLADLGEQTLTDGTKLPLPPVLLASFGDPKKEPWKPTLVVYGHLDVQPAYKSDGWDTEPFELTEVDGKLYGRGASDDKGPVTAWLWVIEALRALNKPLPCHLRCVFEGMEESGSIGLPELVRKLGAPGKHLDPAVCDFVCISDNYYCGKKPCVTHGLRGNVYFHMAVTCSSKDMHSGVIGGSVHEAMTDLVRVMAALVDSSGKILVPGIQDDVSPMTEAERQSYSTIDFDMEEYKKDIGVAGVTDALLHDTAEKNLMYRWRYPTLSLHGIEGAFDGAGSKTVIPRKVVGKFSIRIVPAMDPEKVEAQVRAHVESEWGKLGTKNLLDLKVDKASMPWYRSPEGPNFAAAAAATVRVHGVEPCYTREGGSIPITQVFEEACDATCVLLPIGASDDGAHSQNEKIDRANYLNGVKTLGAYLDELGRLPRGADGAGEAEARASRAASKDWRRRCKKDMISFGCDCCL